MPEQEYPQSVKIGPRTYQIKWDQDSWENGPGEETGFGVSHSRHLKIFINPNQHPDQKADTLWHEILHQVLAMNTGSITNYKDMDDLEEHIVSSTSPWIVLILRENPDILDYILEPW